MADPSISPNAISLLHASVRALALGLVALLCMYTALQHIAVRWPGGWLRRFAAGSLRRNLIIGLVLVGSLPAASLGLLLAERSAQLREEQVSAKLYDLAHAMARDVDQFIDKHRAGLLSAAHAINTTADFTPSVLANWLQIFHANYPDFLTMLATDDRGDILSATSLISGLPAPVSNLQGQNVSDRPYYHRPMTDGRWFVSKVFQGRGLGRDPIIAVSALLQDKDGNRVGVVEGSVNLRAFRRLEVDRHLADGSTVIVLDPEQRVIYASANTGLDELEPLLDSPIMQAAKMAGIGRAFSYEQTHDTAPARFVAASAGTGNGWAVVVSEPNTGIEKQMLGDYKVALALLLTAVVLSLLLASAMARRVTLSVKALSGVVKSFKLDGKGEDIVVPDGTPLELRPIFKQMQRRSVHLRGAHERLRNAIATGERLQRELTQSVAHKEAEIAERTAQLQEANARLEEINRRDSLTGIANRRAFEQFEERAWRLCARERNELTLVMIDIDFFKDFNDSQGHQKGDECLRRVAQAIEACATRPMDLVARYGGEEFVAVLSATPLEKGLIVAERMRKAVQSLGIAHDGSPRGVVTVSLGVAAAQPAGGDNSQATLNDADKALYEAKGTGRNRIVFARGGHFNRYRPDAKARLRAIDT